MMRRGSFHKPSTGFTLVEVVVSLAILSLSLGVLYQSFAWSGRRTASLANNEAAWLAAQSLLAEIRGQPTLQPGDNEGEWSGGMRWKTRVRVHDGASYANRPMQPFAVTIEVRWGERRSQRVELQSIELVKVRT